MIIVIMIKGKPILDGAAKSPCKPRWSSGRHFGMLYLSFASSLLVKRGLGQVKARYSTEWGQDAKLRCKAGWAFVMFDRTPPYNYDSPILAAASLDAKRAERGSNGCALVNISSGELCFGKCRLSPAHAWSRGDFVEQTSFARGGSWILEAISSPIDLVSRAIQNLSAKARQVQSVYPPRTDHQDKPKSLQFMDGLN